MMALVLIDLFYRIRRLLWKAPAAPPAPVEPPEPTVEEFLELVEALPEPKKLNIGAGPNPLPGWLNVDIEPHHDVIKMDATKQFPFEDGTFSHIFSEHAIEHLEQWGAENMLRESYRVLRPGGRIRIATPDNEFLRALQQPPYTTLQRNYISWACHHFAPNAPACGATVDDFFRRSWGHQHIYDGPALWAMMRTAGFVDPVRCALQESEDRELQSLHNPTRMPEGFLNLETMTIEARKPA
jgi:predicted SAM-dependent methyltransferase